MNKEEFEKNFGKVKVFFSNQKVQWAIVGVLMTFILIMTCIVRLSNMPLLVDETTNESIPMALDPFYFLRLSEVVLENGSLDGVDTYRVSAFGDIQYLQELLPYANVGTFKFLNFIGIDVSLAYCANINVVIFYAIGIIVFFFLCYLLTKNKWISLGSCLFLSVTAAYLYRTMAGFADHEAIGMVSLLLAFLSMGLVMKEFDSSKKTYLKLGLLGALVGFLTMLTVASWGGSARFIFIVFPLAIVLYWIFNIKIHKGISKEILLTYGCWLVGFLLSAPLFNYGIKDVIKRYLLSTTGMVGIAVLLFMIVDFFVFKYLDKIKFINKKYRILYSLVVTLVVGCIGLFIIGRNPFSLVGEIVNYLLTPFGTERVSTTVAENSQPYLSDWISNTGSYLFWLFCYGMLFFGLKLMKTFNKTSHKVGFIVSYILMICGILLSRISSTSVLNGDNFISKIFYFVPLLFFWCYLLYLRFEEQFAWNGMETFIFSWLFFTLISCRAAARMFFAITPFVCFMGAYCIYGLIKEAINAKDETWKVVSVILVISGLIISGIAVFQSYRTISITAKYTGLSADSQWQKAMAWVRENTTEDSIFAHWWDYGYWVEYLGQRRTIADGGHFQSPTTTHNIARYLLTTPWVESANEFLKSMNVSYLLIDPTDLGKYSAYSKIGSNDSWDRFSVIPIGGYNVSQVQETANETIRLYYFSGVVDSDLEYLDASGKKIFLPGPTYNSIGNPTYNSYLGGVYLRMTNTTLLQPTAVYFYNNKYYSLPLRYIYFQNKLYDFKSGIDSVISVLPGISSSGSIDSLGGMIYLSPKVKDSLFAQLYLLDDAFDNYDNFELAHEELDVVMTQVRAITGSFEDEEFVIYNGDLRGPIKIFDVSNATGNVSGIFYENLDGKYATLDKYFE